MVKYPLNQSNLNDPSKHQSQKDEHLSNEQMAFRYQSEEQPHNGESLCDDCRAVDWSSLPTLAADGLLKTKNVALRSLNATVEELKSSSCRVCAILSTIKNPDFDGQNCVLKALPLSRHFNHHVSGVSRRFLSNHHDLDIASLCTVLGVFKTGKGSQWCKGPQCLAVTRLDYFGPREIMPRLIDYNKSKDLVKICENQHKKSCKAKTRRNVLGLKVIDTRIQQVVEAPDQCKYLALSYVWGKQEGNGLVHDIRNSPPVIRDAISVTNSMGYNYLWVDRYCISDPEEKHRMISQMDQIYANASITIIAAADGDTEIGLCGVSKPRKLQKRVDIQDVTLLELPLGPEDLSSSKWASRGWTYQEGYLSTRRLIFTTTQLLFLCNKLYASESLQQLLNATSYSNQTWRFKRLIPAFTNAKPRFSAEDLLNQVEEYTKRELTQRGDSLNAFLGVLRYYAKNSANSTSPVLQLPWGLIANKHVKKNDLRLHFFWYHDNPATRQPDFPSWSWTGWGGPVTFCKPDWKITLQSLHEVEEGPFSYLDWKIRIEEKSGKITEMYDLALQEFEKRKVKHRLHQPGPKQLQITCAVVPVSFQNLELTKDQRGHATKILISDTGELVPVSRNLTNGVWPMLQVWDGIYVGSDQAHLDQQVEQEDCIMGLIFARRVKRMNWAYHHCLLVRQMSDGFYERVGLLTMLELDLEPRGLTTGGFTHMQSEMVFSDISGSILDKLEISEWQRRRPFAETSQSRTICLI